MANSTSPVPQVIEGTGAVAKINELMDALSQGLIGGKNWATSALLVWGYLGGRVEGINVANGTLTLGASTTSYVVMKKSDGVVSFATGTTNWNDTGNYWRLYSVVTDATTVTSYNDERLSAAGLFGSSGGGASTLASLTDVNVPSPSNLEVLTYDSGTSKWVAAALGSGSGDMLSPLLLSEIAVTTTATLTIGRMHVCSGTSADYTVALPAVSGNAGKFLGLRIDTACTRWITVDGNSSELIDGALTRRMWRHESAILYCDGVSWTKVGGKTIPLKCTMNKTNTTSIPASVWTLMPMNAMVRDNASFMATPLADTTNGWIRCLRGGSYTVSGATNYTAVTPGILQAAGVINRKLSVPGGYSINDPQDDPMAWSSLPADAAGSFYMSFSGNFEGVILGDSLAITTFNNDSVSRSNATGITIRPSLSALEIPEW